MMSETHHPGGKPTIFADALTDAVIAHGVARMTLATVGADGKPAPVAALRIPVTQLPAFAAGITRLLHQMQEKAREVRAAAQQAGGQS